MRAVDELLLIAGEVDVGAGDGLSTEAAGFTHGEDYDVGLASGVFCGGESRGGGGGYVRSAGVDDGAVMRSVMRRSICGEASCGFG